MSADNGFTPLRIGQAIPRAEVAVLPFAEFRRSLVDAVSADQRVAALFGDAPDPAGPVPRLLPAGT